MARLGNSYVGTKNQYQAGCGSYLDGAFFQILASFLKLVADCCLTNQKPPNTNKKKIEQI